MAEGDQPMRGMPVIVALLVGAQIPVAPAVADPVAPAVPVPALPTTPVPVPPPSEPAPQPPAPFTPERSGIGNPLGQSGSQPAGPFGLPDLSAYGANLLLGQSNAPLNPAAPGAPAAAAVPNLNAFNPDYLLGQNVTPAGPGDKSTAPGIGPGPDSPGTGRIAFLRRLYEMYQSGQLKGSLLGQESPEEFAQQAGIVPAPGPD